MASSKQQASTVVRSSLPTTYCSLTTYDLLLTTHYSPRRDDNLLRAVEIVAARVIDVAAAEVAPEAPQEGGVLLALPPLLGRRRRERAFVRVRVRVR